MRSAGASLSLDAASTPGNAVINFSKTGAALPAGVVRLGAWSLKVLDRQLPLNLATALLHFSSVKLNGVAKVGADAVQVYPTSAMHGDAKLSGGDPAVIDRVAQAPISARRRSIGGFAAFRWSTDNRQRSQWQRHHRFRDKTLMLSYLSGTRGAQITH